MSEFPPVRALDFSNGVVLSTATALLGLNNVTAFTSTAWPGANIAIFVPVLVASPLVVYKLVAGGGVTTAGNFDIGIYDALGNKIVSSGATAKTASVEHVVDIADTPIGPGLYYLAMSADGTNNYILCTPSGTSPVPLQKARLAGTLQMAAAYPLPATATFAARTTPEIPGIAAYLKGY